MLTSLVGMAFVTATASGAVAQEATPAPSPPGPPLPANCEVAASGLVNPRFVAVGDDGTLYVSEAGVAGDESIYFPPEAGATPTDGATPEPAAAGSRGTTGEVTTVAPSGEKTVLVSGLPSYGSPMDAVGPAGIVMADGSVEDVATGLSSVSALEIGPDGSLYATQITADISQQPPAPGSVVRINADGTTEVVLDNLPFPNGVTFDGEGNLYVVTGAVTVPEAGIDGMVLRCTGAAG